MSKVLKREDYIIYSAKAECPICGCGGLRTPPYDGRGQGSDEICPCCGYQFNCDEWDFTFAEWRARWVAGGCKWWSPSRSKSRHPPEGWDPAAQLARVTTDE